MATFKKPIALPGARVMAHNYKKKILAGNRMVDAGQWESGKVIHTKTSWHDDGTWRHSYDVVLDRKAKGKYGDYTGCLRLYLNEDQIEVQK